MRALTPRLHTLVSLLALSTACGGGSGPQESENGAWTWPASESASVTIKETQETLRVTELHSGSYGEIPDGRRMVSLVTQQGVHFQFSFLSKEAATPSEFAFDSESVKSGYNSWNDGLNVLDYRGFEGGPRDLCDLSADVAFPGSATRSGSVVFTELKLSEKDFVNGAHGTFEATLTNCTLPGTSVANQNITVVGQF